MGKVAVADAYVPAKYDNYGNRRGPALGFVLHMAEGWNVSRYLSVGNVKRGVSVHFTVEKDGKIVQMMGLDRISGSINPKVRRYTNTRRYGHEHAVHALGDWWTNPNNAVISVEVAGFQKDGPNPKQVAAIAELFAWLVKKYPRLIPLGHADFQALKPCPGTKFFDEVYHVLGGHGKDYKKTKPPVNKPTDTSGDDVMLTQQAQVKTTSNWIVTLPKGTAVYAKAGDATPLLTVDSADDFEYYGTTRDGKFFGVELKANLADGTSPRVIAYVKNDAAFKLRAKPVVADQRDATIAALKAQLTAVQTAIAAAAKAASTKTS